MWTKRKRYIREKVQLIDYLKTAGFFHDYIIGAFSYDSASNTIFLTIEEDCLAVDNTNSEALVWDLRFEGVSHFTMKDMDGLSPWWLYEHLLEDDTFKFQLVNGYFSFKAATFSLGVPHEVNVQSDTKMSKLDSYYLFQEFRKGEGIEVAFDFEGNYDDFFYYIGYDKEKEKPYWARRSDKQEVNAFTCADALFETKLYDGKSLKERWSDVTIYSVNGLSLSDWLSYGKHFVETYVYDSQDEAIFYINGVALAGSIEQDRACPSCGLNQCYLEDYDDYCCPYCNRWMTDEKWDSDEGYYFERRPLEPGLLWKPHKRLRFCQVQYSLDGNPYTYYCPDKAIVDGDYVIVPVGKANTEKEAHVIRVFESPAHKPPYPLDKIKTVIRKSQGDSKELIESLQTLLASGVVCDLSQKKNHTVADVPYDVLKTPIGHFWLALNDEPVKMKTKASYPDKDAKYFVEASYSIKPYSVDFEDFQHLKICTDIDLRKARLIDNLHGQYELGYNWQVGDKDIGIAAYLFSGAEDEVIENLLGVPYYVRWYEEYKESYGFTVAWKHYVSDDNLSVCFNI